jgi:hypothetical protein
LAEAANGPCGRIPAAALTCSDVATIRAGLPEKWGFCWGVYPGAAAFLNLRKTKAICQLVPPDGAAKRLERRYP